MGDVSIFYVGLCTWTAFSDWDTHKRKFEFLLTQWFFKYDVLHKFSEPLHRVAPCIFEVSTHLFITSSDILSLLATFYLLSFYAIFSISSSGNTPLTFNSVHPGHSPNGGSASEWRKMKQWKIKDSLIEVTYYLLLTLPDLPFSTLV